MNPPLPPVLRVVSGDPTAEELAALVAVVTARAGGSPDDSPARPDWATYWRAAGAAPRPGPGAWRSSALPRSGS